MRITDIKVFPVGEEKLKAFISIVLDECFMVNDIKVIKGKEGFFISMPSRRKRNGKFKDIAHPLNNETRQEMEREILAAYEKSLVDAPEDHVEVQARPRDAGRPRSRSRSRRTRKEARGESGTRETRGKESRSGESDRSEVARNRDEERVRENAEEASAARAGRAGGTDVGDSAREPEGASEGSGKSAEEVAEHHLRDSFWGT